MSTSSELLPAQPPARATDDAEAGPPAIVDRRPRSLSPSRAADFKACPLKYRLRTIDRLPETPSPAATRGTLVHAVLERLFELPRAARTPDAAKSMVLDEWQRLLADEPELTGIIAQLRDGAGPDAVAGDVLARWLAGAARLLDAYFELEDPRRLEPVGRELLVEFELDEGPVLRGIIDRLDATAAGDLRVVDYKTGASPGELFEARALFQMKFYALVLYRSRGIVPRQLRLVYLGDGDILSYAPDGPELDRFEGTLRAIWAAIRLSTETRDFRPNPGRICGWCAHQALCPAFGGTPPPYPVEPVEEVEPIDTVEAIEQT